MLKELRALRPRSEFLGQLDEDDLAALARVLLEERCSAGEVLYEAGTAGDQVYLVLEGSVSLESAEPSGGVVPPQARTAGQLVGVVAFAAGTARRRTARCTEESRLATLTRDQFQHLLDHRPDTWRKLELMALERMRREQLAQHLDRVFGPFGPLLPFVLQEVGEHSQWLTLKSGQTLYTAGDEADGAYVLLTGRLLVVTETEDGERVVGTVLAGETIGEVALVAGRKRADTVYAARDSELVKLSRHMFELMLQRSSRAMYKVAGILVNRLVHRRSEQEAARMPVRAISLVPASASAPVRELSEGLMQCLSTHGKVMLLSRKSVAAELGLPGVAQATETEPLHLRLTDWLHRQEERCRYLVYQADYKWTPWTERCARQADRLVVVADAGTRPDLEELDERLSGPRRRWSLLLLHPEETDRPHDTARWLAGTGAESVYHARRGNERDLARLARTLSGNATGLVLGGGGARGFAHLGVLQALEELGVPVDMVGGASIGAPVAGWVAQGLSAEAANKRAIVAFHNLMDVTLPFVSMLNGRRISTSIYNQTGTWDIEDYWLPFFCVSTDVTNSRQVVHKRGNSARAIRTSVSIPGILPPVPEDGHLLVDGGVVNNLPIDVMRDMNPFGRVIAIDVGAPTGPAAKVDHGLSVSGWRQLFNTIHPFRKPDPLPRMGATIMQSLMVGSASARERALEANLADLYLNIHVRGVGLLQFEAVEKAAKIGYEESIGALREWLAASDRQF